MDPTLNRVVRARFLQCFFFSTLNQTFFEGVKRIGSRDTWRQNDIQKKILNGLEMIN